jgi:hypothetical protein
MKRWGVPAVVPRMRACVCAAKGRLANSEGFTIVETIVASVVLVVGLLGAFLMLDVAAATSSAARARAGATNLARELSEDSRAIPWSQIDPSTIVSQLQQFPGLANTSGGSTWQVSRSGFTYTVTASACYVDDPKDGYGDHSGGGFCADSTVPAGVTLTDPTPIDLKRVSVNVSWTVQNLTHTVSEVATLTSAGQALGLQTSGLMEATPTLTSSPKITSTGTTALTFEVTAPPGTTAIVWTVNGAAQAWGATQSGNVWTSATPWGISQLSDGTYTVGAAAEDANGIIGPAVTMPVVLIRNIPAAPNIPWYGFNSNLISSGSSSPSTVAELRWAPNQEANVIGYRIYKGGSAICSTSQATSYTFCSGSTSVWCAAPNSCIDLNPGSTSNLTYQIAALYYDANNVVQAGPPRSVTLTGTSSNAYTFSPSTGNTSANCSGSSALADMLGTYTPGGTDSAASGAITFCSDPFTSGAMIEGGGTATAYFANSGSTSCQVNATLNTDGSSTGAVTSSATIPAGTNSAAASTFTFTNPQVLTMNVGDRLDLNFDMTASGCSSTVLHYGSTGAPSQFQTAPLPITPPGAPGSLQLNVQNGGATATLKWSPSTTGAPVSFYRVYRGGTDYTHRYDDNVPVTDCTNGICTFPDSKRPSPPYTYYVTAVGGTTPGSNMAESTETGPVTG